MISVMRNKGLERLDGLVPHAKRLAQLFITPQLKLESR